MFRSIFLVTICFLMPLASEAKQADSNKFSRTARLTEINIDPDLDLGNVVGGSISVNTHTKELMLYLERRSACPTDRFCPSAMPMPLIIRMQEAVAAQSSKCGDVTYVGQIDERRSGGDAEVLKVTDHSQSVCDGQVYQMYATQVVYKIVTAQNRSYTSTFKASPLVEVNLLGRRQFRR